MKYLILFLITFNVYANIKVEIENTKNGRKYGAVFNSQMELDLWKSKNIANNSWGKPDRWIKKELEQTCPTTYRVINEGTEDEYTECFYPVEYTIIETDISAQVQAEQSKRDACQVLEVKLKTPADLTLAEMNSYLRCR